MTSLYACLYEPPRPGGALPGSAALVTVAEQFSPRYEQLRGDVVVIDVSGLERLLGAPRVVGEELRRDAADRGLRVHVAIASTRIAALVLALARPGLTVVRHGDEAAALAPVPIHVLDLVLRSEHGATPSPSSAVHQAACAGSAISTFHRWGIKSFGELAALPAADVRARLGADGLLWHAMARGEDLRPLVPARGDERFDAAIELEWPIDALEPLSFVLTRLLEPLSTRLERRDRGAAVLHVHLRLITRELYARRLELPTPMRDVRTLRTLALLDLESHPAPAAIDAVTITIDPTPGRILQHTLFARPVPTPEQISTLLARLTALMGADRIGAPRPVDTHRPGAFAMEPFATDHDQHRGARRAREDSVPREQAALRRCRQPVPARVVVDADERPVRVTTDRRGFAGGAVAACSGPWRTSGNWWQGIAAPADASAWNRDEWDVTLGDGGVYRIFRDRLSEGWFIDAIVD